MNPFFCRSIPFIASWFLGVTIGFTAEVNFAGGLVDGNYTVRQWKTDQGLPQNTVRCLLQTSDGYLWIGTQAGLARFDGVRFTIFNHANTPQMANDNCVTLAEGLNGTLWVGTEDGLLLWERHRFQAIDLGTTNVRQSYIRNLSLGRNGVLWVGTYDGLYSLDRGQVTRYSDADGLQGNFIHTVFEDQTGHLWVGTEKDRQMGGLQRRDAGATTFHLVPDEGISTNDVTHCFLGDFRGAFWWGNNKGVHGLMGDQERHFTIQDGLSGNRVWRLAPCQDGGVLAVVAYHKDVPGRQGLQKLDPVTGQIHSIPLPDDATGSDIICAIEDAEEAIWVGTRYNGLFCLRTQQVCSFTPRNGLLRDRVNGTLASQDGLIHVATTEGWYRIRDAQVLPAPVDVGSHHIYGFLEDAAGRIFVGLRTWPGILDSDLRVFTGEGVIGGYWDKLLS